MASIDTPPPTPVILMLPGQGSQYPGMAHGLYGTEAVFTRVVDEVLGLLGAEGRRVRDDWLAERPLVDLDDVTRAQPLIFALDVAYGALLISWGVRPAALVGHSAGEYAAAVLAGIMKLPDAVAALDARVRALATAPRGGMASVAASPAMLTPWLTSQVVVGAVNAPLQVMIAGPEPQLSAVTGALTAGSVTWMRAKATTGFHSPSVEAACASTRPVYERIDFKEPRTVVVSGYTARPLAEPQLSDPEFWAMQPARTVLFDAALTHLLDSAGPVGGGPFLLVEAGPGEGLSLLARRHRAVTRNGSAVVPLSPVRAGSHLDVGQLAVVAQKLRDRGHRLGHRAPAPANPVNPANPAGPRGPEGSTAPSVRQREDQRWTARAGAA
ncbi:MULTISPECIES: acyltransferase domain-containing protein [Streptomyces]|uniref:Polyketide synthase n=1 Tax=Streptomyces venezuelae TaxID=54571 RepID=A0A5P2AWC9_STRVZ|nr:acyltransferase domain-containing protein [Streptomyces venezuelae]QES22513.1 polyketide synthase [Streptomyces venezuelae]